MKLRIKGNTLRLRLTRSEVSEFAETGRFSETVSLAPSEFVYSIEISDKDTVTAQFIDGKLTVFVPASIANEWADGEQIGFEGKQPLNDNNELHIIIEKDFACLTPRENEDTADHYPHPKPNIAKNSKLD